MQYQDSPIAPVHRDVLSGSWSLTPDREALSDGETSVIPDGYVEIAVPSGAGAVALGASPTCPRAEAGRAFVVGPASRPLPLCYAGRVGLLAIRLEIRVALRILGADLARLENRAERLEHVAPALAQDLARCQDPANPSATLDRMQGLVARAARRSPPPDPRLDRALAALASRRGGLSVSLVAEAAGLSPRQLDRLFTRFVGLSPKLLSRVVRFRCAWNAGVEHSGDWASIAARCGYADQSHLVRDFRAFAGAPPTAALPQAS
jgi:AraC-like DNA-binding protein